MASLDFSICYNTRARQVQDSILKEIKSTLKTGDYSCNVIDIRRLQASSEQELGATLIAIGGDGTVNAVASKAIEHNRQLAVVPLGTFNHFAKDIGLPLDAAEAIALVSTGRTKKVDYAEVNGELFLNNSVIGLYPHVVAKKENLRRRFGKWPALLLATITIVGRVKRYRLKLVVDGTEMITRTTMMVISNNKYTLDDVGLAGRESIDQGKLFVYVIKHKSLIRMAVVSFRLLLGRTKSSDFDLYHCQELEVISLKSRLRVALDGETKVIETPLIYKIYKKSLTVVC